MCTRLSSCIYEASSGGLFPYGEVELRGTKGTLNASESGYRITSAKPGQFQSWMDPIKDESYESKDEMLGDGSSRDSTTNLVKDFVECVKTRATPIVPLEEGASLNQFCSSGQYWNGHKERLQWDAEKEIFTNSEAANKLLHYEYRAPWKVAPEV